MLQNIKCTLQLVKLCTQSRLICVRPSQTKFKSLTVNYSVGTHYVNFHYGLVSRLWFNAVHSSHMYDHQCIVLFTLPFHFQLNTKSQNGAFHFKLFSDFIFDLVMTPQNSVKLIKSCLAVHYGCTFIFHVLQHFHITLSRSLRGDWEVRLWCSPGAHGHFPIVRPRGSLATGVMKSISGEVIRSLCVCVIADKQKKGFWFESLHHALGMPFEKPSRAAAGNS